MATAPHHDSALTPHRTTSLTLDVNETVAVEAGLRLLRSGSDIGARFIAGSNTNAGNLRFWPSGCWTLEPLQFDIANITETTVGLESVIRASSWTTTQATGPNGLISLLDEVAMVAVSDMPGSYYGGDVPSTGDYFLRKSVPASGSCDPGSVVANNGFDSLVPQIPYPNTDIPMDRNAYTAVSYPANQPFFLRWFVPASANAFYRYLFTFYFGQYAVSVGNGKVSLWELCEPSGGGAYRWKVRDNWSIGAQGCAPGTGHCMGIFPHRSPWGDNFICFSDISADTGSPLNSLEILSSKATSVGIHTYKMDPTNRNGDMDPAPGFATMSAPVHMDIRREWRGYLQVSEMSFHQSGTLTDDPANVANFAFSNNVNPVNGEMILESSAGYTINFEVLDASTGNQFVAGTGTQPQAQFVFTSVDGASTPALWAYTLKQEPVISTSSPGQFTVPAKTYSIDFAAGDPQTENANITGIVDIAGSFPRLQNRGRFSALLQTTYTPPGTLVPINVVLSRGVVTNNHGVQKGTGRISLTGQDTYWKEYDQIISGMWDRLKEYSEPGYQRIYAIDPKTPNTTQPWTVTDAITDLLLACGFTSAQVNILSLPIRFWPNQSMKLEEAQIDPTANLAEAIVRMCRDYLGAYLHFEANAGAAGQWILIFATQAYNDGTFTPLYNFIGQSHGQFAPPTNLAAFPALTTFYSTKEVTAKAPDANQIIVMCSNPVAGNDTNLAIQATASNPLSYNVPGMSVRPDPTSPDYLGYNKIIRVSNPNLLVKGDQPNSNGLYPLTQNAVNWTCRRYYDFLCHGQKIVKITAPLVFIQDQSLLTSASNGWRPLRFQDPVSLDGDPSWLIKSVNATYDNDRMQMARYELIQPIASQYFYGFDGTEVIRRLRRQGVAATAGHLSHSAMYGQFSPSAHREMSAFHSAVAKGNFKAIQNPDGSFIPIQNWLAATGAAG